MNLNVIKRTLGIAIVSLMSMNCVAQDIIARQAPSDRRLKDLKSIKINNTMSAPDLSQPAADIYVDWKNDHVTSVSGHVPANFKVDLRGFCMPTPSRQVTSNFGRRWGRNHEGLDIKVYTGDTIRAAFDGKVRITKYNAGGYGYYVVIRHTNGLETLYGHLSKIIAKENMEVRAGEVIGLGGNTGRSTGSHLHFETRLLGKAINPALMFDFEKQDVTSDFYVVKGAAMTKGAVADATIKQMDMAIESNNTNDVANAAEVEEPVKQEAPAPKATKSNKSTRNQKQKSASYKVKDGDTLYNIAKKHGTTVAKLCKINGIKESGLLRKGQVIKTS